MTREETIEVLKDLWRYEHSEFSEKDIREAIDMAIRALKNEPTDGDLISRDYVLSKFKEQCDRCGKYKENNGVMCRCCALDDAIDYVEEAPSAEKTAEWKKISPAGIYECTNCECWSDDKTRYCPTCGRRMKGVEE